MNLTCPSCDTTFRVDAERLGPKGRSVRCGACGKSWFQEPEARPDEAAAEPERAPETAAVEAEVVETREAAPVPPAEAPAEAPAQTQAEVAVSEAEAPPAEPEAPAPAVREVSEAPAPAERRDRPRPARKAARKRRAAAEGASRVALGWVLFVLVVAALAGGFYFGQREIVARVPAMARLYDLVGLGAAQSAGLGLELRDVKSVRRLVDGARVVVIEGIVANVAEAPRDVPKLRARLIGTEGENLEQWTFAAEETHLPPGGTTRFETMAENPPRQGQLSIEFVTGD